MPQKAKATDVPTRNKTLQNESRVPLYQQIYVILRNKIEAGDLAPGDVVAGEKELCVEFGVSRITARRALNELAQSGLVERQRGRGTRVITQSAQHPLVTSIDGLLESVDHIARTTTARNLSHGPVRAGRTVAQALGVEKTETVIRSVRVRCLGDAPMSYVVMWVPQDIGARVSEMDLTDTPLLLLLEQAGVDVAQAQQSISATIADAEVAKALEIPAGAPLIDSKRIVRDISGRAVEYIRILYRPEFYRFDMTLHRISDSSGKKWSSGDQISLEGPD